jgi:hypothetical protein
MKGMEQYLKYVANTNGHATVANFDEDWEPIGPQLRRDLMPRYFIENAGGKIVLTDEGRAAISAA